MTKIWFQDYDIAQWQHISKGNMLEHLGIEITAIGENYIEGTMPVDHRTVQPHGILHGGASVVLAESLGSIASNMVVDYTKFACVGLDINANHLRPVSSGKVRGVAKAIHIGKKTHVWSIEIYSDDNKLVCISRLTMAVIEK